MQLLRRPTQVLSQCLITVVVKIPRLPFDKFISAKRTLTTQMKATGEVMSICDNFEGALMKAIRSLEQHVDSLMSYDFTDLTDDELLEQLEIVDDMRIWRDCRGNPSEVWLMM